MLCGARYAVLPGTFLPEVPSHGPWRRHPGQGVRGDDIDRAPSRRSVSVADISIAEQTSRHLVPPFIQPLMSLLTEPAPSSLAGIANLSGRQLDANRQSRRDLIRRAPSPAEPEHSKKARTPSTEEDEGIEEMVRCNVLERTPRYKLTPVQIYRCKTTLARNCHEFYREKHTSPVLCATRDNFAAHCNT